MATLPGRKMYLACRCIQCADRPGLCLTAVKSHKTCSSHKRTARKTGRVVIYGSQLRCRISLFRDTACSKCGVRYYFNVLDNNMIYLFMQTLHLPFFFLLKERSLTSAPGRDVNGASLVLMS